MVQGLTHPLEINSTRPLRVKEKSCRGLLASIIDGEKRQSQRKTARTSSAGGSVPPSNKSRKHSTKNGANFRHQLLVIDQRLSAIEQNQDSIHKDYARFKEKLVSIKDEQNMIRNQQADIARDQDRIGREFADIRREYDSISRGQDDIEREQNEIRLTQEDIRNGFSHLRSEFCQRRRSLEDLGKRASVIAENQAHERRVLEDKMKFHESLRRALDVLDRFPDEEEDL